jgi:hypothetical protein
MSIILNISNYAVKIFSMQQNDGWKYRERRRSGGVWWGKGAWN